jgi:hypothetical protein
MMHSLKITLHIEQCMKLCKFVSISKSEIKSAFWGSSNGGDQHTLSFPFRFWLFMTTHPYNVFLNLRKSLLLFGSQFRICLKHICLPFIKCSISSCVFVFTIFLFSSKLFYLFHTCCYNLSSKLIKPMYLQNLIIFPDFLFYNILPLSPVFIQIFKLKFFCLSNWMHR